MIRGKYQIARLPLSSHLKFSFANGVTMFAFIAFVANVMFSWLNGYATLKPAFGIAARNGTSGIARPAGKGQAPGYRSSRGHLWDFRCGSTCNTCNLVLSRYFVQMFLWRFLYDCNIAMRGMSGNETKITLGRWQYSLQILKLYCDSRQHAYKFH